MIALKFLRAGRTGPFSGVVWPEPGIWLEAAGDPPRACRTAVHACTPEDLPLWLDDELWRVELRGPVTRAHDKLAAPAGRLLEPVAAWNPRTVAAYADACSDRARVLARRGDPRGAELAADAGRCAGAAGTPTMAAGAALCAARVRALQEPGGIAAERAWQAAWLADRLGV
jgi:hypothetical protein